MKASSVLAAMAALNYPVFSGDWNITLVGVRSSDRDANTFNDAMFVFFSVDDQQHSYKFDCTTDPGVYYREHSLNENGTASIVPGRYPSCWEIGKHQGKYEALVQRGPITVYRDNDGDSKLDETNKTETGYFGINCHRASANNESKQVDRWSAGCQVIADPLNFDLFMALIKKAASIYGGRFSYTLLTEDQL